MRIVAGALRGRALVAPPGAATRPTADRVRQAIFDVLAHAEWAPPLDDARVLDLFAGSGALGFEALSRGAAFALFVDTDEAARGVIRENVEALGLYGACRIHRRDACDLGARPASAGPPFDLAFLDPPYARGFGARAVEGLERGGWLTAAALCILERGADEAELAASGSWKRMAARRWGAAQVDFLQRG